MNDDNTPSIPTDRRPLGFWLRTVDALITREFANAFAGESVTRRDWMLLNALAGDVDTTWLTERLARKGKRLRRLEDLGWAEEQGDGTWTLTDAGREAKERLGAIVDGVRERVSGAVSPEDFATTMASLEAIARELGWDEGMRMPRTGRRGFGRGRGFGPGRGRGFAPGFGPDFGYGFDPRAAFGYGFGPGFSRDLDDEDDHAPHHGHAHPHHGHGHGHGHGCHGGHPHAGHGHGQRAYERGFDAGFARGRTEG